MKILYQLATGIFHIIYRLNVKGKENLPEKGPYIICPNHHHNIDPPLMSVIFKEKTYFMAKEELFQKKWFAKLITSFGAFPVKRGGRDKAAIVTAMRILKKEKPLCIFPEGRRVKLGEKGEIKEGALRIAQKMNCVIVPVHISGNYKLFSRMKVEVKKPIEISKEADLKEIAEKLSNEIHK